MLVCGGSFKDLTVFSERFRVTTRVTLLREMAGELWPCLPCEVSDGNPDSSGWELGNRMSLSISLQPQSGRSHWLEHGSWRV